MSSIVHTVVGDMLPENLGFTLPHEHLALNCTHLYRKPPQPIAEKFNNAGFEYVTIGYIKQYPYSHKYNLVFNDKNAKEAVLKDIRNYKKNGGGTIVENTTEGLERDVDFYQTVQRKTGVNIVIGTGFYIADMQSMNHLLCKKEDLYNHMLTELTEGCEGYPSVKAGFIGEIASVWPIRDFERKAILAAGEVQAQVGCGVSFHPHYVTEAPFEIMRLYMEAGGKIDKAVMSHLDRTLLDPAKLLEFSDLGAYCQFDLFGTEVSYCQLNIDTDMPSDAQRLNMICHLLEEGKADRILMSHESRYPH
ncbi:unnamed protein product [Euphydryas editha]|uniref:Phosphotriesterase-related protein n=1 Tax=Euphydryas editha TaxID=104508 RepID=A0AAU9TVD0_EUPED|nr:unnamed protein product [Euphydryas editha]